MKKIVLLICLTMFCFGQDVQQLEKACNNKNYDSCLKIAELYLYDAKMYLYGKHAYDKVSTYGKMACDNEKFEACDILGELYVTEERYDTAMEYFTKGCDGKDVQSCYDLGFIYDNAIGMKYEDDEKAKKYYKKACDLGFQEGCDAYELNKKGIKKEDTN